MTTLAVTGATGVLGRFVAQELADRGLQQRLLARTPAKAPNLPGATVHRFAYDARDETAAALDGVDILFMVSASESAERLEQHRIFVDTAATAGVKHIVYTSFFGASPTATFTLARDHDITEKYIAATGVGYTFLRDNLYLDFMDALVGDDDVIRGPAGAGRVSAVARIDIAQAAVTVLTDPEAHAHKTYDLTGRESLTMTEIAKILSAHRGSPVSFHNETIEEAYESRKRWDEPQWQYDAWVSTYTAIAEGEMARISPHLEQLLGHPPLTLREFLASAPAS